MPNNNACLFLFSMQKKKINMEPKGDVVCPLAPRTFENLKKLIFQQIINNPLTNLFRAVLCPTLDLYLRGTHVGSQ